MSSNKLELPNGYRLNEYTIVRKIGAGGFSIVYLARDGNGLPVAIKEYLPDSLALRLEGSALVQATTVENSNIFRHGMRSFFEEGRALAKINHPNVVRVSNFFRANDTVYMVLHFERGKTLQQYIQAKRGSISERFIRRVFAQLLDGLREVHTHKLLHLDIKPTNLYIRLDGSPVILDFGAARQTLTEEVPRLLLVGTKGFSAPEQISRGADPMGPWTDIYAIGATLYCCLSGGTQPQESRKRLKLDEITPASICWKGKFTAQFLETIDRCMMLDYRARPESVFSLQKMLLDKPAIPAKRGAIALFRNRFFRF